MKIKRMPYLSFLNNFKVNDEGLNGDLIEVCKSMKGIGWVNV